MAAFRGPLTYVVRQGDYLEKLAYQLGFDLEAVWNHEKNAELKQKRRDKHNILSPGDILYIPELSPAPEHEVAVGTENNYIAQIPTRLVTLILQGDDGPLPNASYTLMGLGDPIEGTSDGEGRISFDVPITVREVDLVVRDYGAFSLGIGDLDPVTEISGLQMRLALLGLYAGRPTGVLDEETRDAILRFQRDNSIEMSGEPSTETIETIEKTYGW